MSLEFKSSLVGWTQFRVSHEVSWGYSHLKTWQDLQDLFPRGSFTHMWAQGPHSLPCGPFRKAAWGSSQNGSWLPLEGRGSNNIFFWTNMSSHTFYHVCSGSTLFRSAVWYTQGHEYQKMRILQGPQSDGPGQVLRIEIKEDVSHPGKWVWCRCTLTMLKL